MNHYPRHIGDIVSATVGLNLTERGAYTALIDQYYLHEAPLPSDRREVYRLAAVVTAAERKAVDYVLSRYFVEMDDGWHQKRCDEELAKYAEKSAKAAASASFRWSERNANAMRTHSEGNANHKPVTNNQGSTKPRAAAVAAPDWIPPEAWDAWKRHRGQRLSAHAQELCIGELAKLMAAGHPPKDVIEQSIRNGWKGLFELKRGNGNAAKQSERQRVAAEIYGAPNERPDERIIDGEAKRVA